MPKCYSERERAYIRQRLKEEAGKCIAQVWDSADYG